MRTGLCRSMFSLAVFAAAACADIAHDPVSVAGRAGLRTTTTATTPAPGIADLDAALGAGMYSLDTTSIGNGARLYIEPLTNVEDEPPAFCRDHFKPIDLWWDGGYGTATFHLDPPLLFVGYRPGTVKTGVLRLRRAIFESVQASEASDPAGNVWRFKGRFNALCAFGELDLGPVVMGGQILRSQDAIDPPVLVRLADSGGCGGSGAGSTGGTELIENVAYDPYDPMVSAYADGGAAYDCGSGTQYEPGDYTGGETVDWGTGTGNGGTSVCGDKALVEYVCIDVYNPETGFWEEWGCGYVTTC
jgi:hypothetical protein